MRFLRFGLLILPVLVLAADMAAAQTAAPLPPAPTPSPAQPAVTAPAKVTTDKLFEALKRERDPDKAKGMPARLPPTGRIPAVRRSISDAMGQQGHHDKKNAAALDFLDQVTLLEPSYPKHGTAAPRCTTPWVIRANPWLTSSRCCARAALFSGHCRHGHHPDRERAGRTGIEGLGALPERLPLPTARRRNR